MPTIFDADLTKLLASPRETPAIPDSSPPRGDAAPSGPRPAAMAMAMAFGAVPPARVDSGTLFALASIDVRHGFANGGDGTFTRLTILPTAVTRNRLALFGLVPRLRPDGIDIVWDTAHRDQASSRFDALRPLIAALPPAERDAAILAVGAIFGEPLLFTVAIDDPRFANYTDMPVDFRIGYPPLVLSTRAVDVQGPDAADFAIAWTSPTTGLQACAVTVAQPPDPQQRHASDSIAAQAERQQLIGQSRYFALLELYFSPAAGTPRTAGTWNGLPVDLARGLLDPGAQGDWRYFTPCRYTVRFAARATRWRYLVAARDGALDPVSLKIVDTDGADAGFVLDPKPHVLPDGRAAACLSRPEALPILAQPGGTFTLLGMPTSGPARRRTLVASLPVAGVERLSLGPAADGPLPLPRSGEPPPLYSDIHVFI